MSASIASSLVALRTADPAADRDVAVLCPEWQSVLTAIDMDAVETLDRRPAPPRRRLAQRGHRLRLAVVAIAVVAAAIFVGVIAWPGSGQGPTAVAYGVTRQSDGTIAVRQSPTEPFTSAQLQSLLRAAGVSADVLVQSPPGACSEPAPTAIPSTGRIVTHPSNIPRTQGFLIHPATIPAGAVLVVVLPTIATSGIVSSTTPAFAALYVTTDPPTCFAPPAESSHSSAPRSVPTS